MGAAHVRAAVPLALFGLVCGCTRDPAVAGAGADAPPWRDAEAEICARLLRVDAQRAAGRPLADDPGLVVSQWIAGYESRWFARSADGWRACDALPAAPPWRVCAWPSAPALAQRAFVLDSSGALLVRDHAAGGAALGADAACAAATSSAEGALLAHPGRARDGSWWWTRDALPLRRVRIEVHAEPPFAPAQWKAYLATAAQAREWCPPRAAFEPLAGEWPTGMTPLDARGGGELLGPALPGRVVALASPGMPCRPVPPGTARAVGDTIEVRLPRDWVLEGVINGDESMAVNALRRLSSAQLQMQASGCCDVDGDGAGEFAFIAELAGREPVVAGTAPARRAPALLPAEFADVRGGCVEHGGYLFRMALPDAQNRPVPEAAGGGRAGCAVDPANAAQCWSVYAWPVEYGVTGLRAFAISQHGDVLTTRNEAHYSGWQRPVPPTAALRAEANGTLRGPYAVNAAAADGSTWGIIQ